MPRRKRTDEGGRRGTKVSKVEYNEEPLVISDSENEEEDASFNRSTRTARWKRRENESHIRDMTEDEMLALAMRLSAQEASSAAERRELEDCDIQKAIEQSLNGSVRKAKIQETEAGSSSDQTEGNEENVASHSRRKLCYPCHDQAPTENDQETPSPLNEMPDLSQTSPASSRSSLRLFGPTASTQDKDSDKTVICATPEKELFRSLPETQSPLILPRDVSLISPPTVSTGKRTLEIIPTSAYAAKSNINPQLSELQESPFSKCQVFTQKDFKPGPEDKDGQTNVNRREDEAQHPDEDTQISTPLNTDSCLLLRRRSLLSSPGGVPENDQCASLKSRTPDLKHSEDQSSQGEEDLATAEVPKTQAWNEFTSHMVLHLPDDDEEENSSEEVLSPSPVFYKDQMSRQIRIEISPVVSHISSSTITINPSTQDTQISHSVLEQEPKVSKTSECKAPSSSEKAEGTITYHWGVPFCPAGQNPDEYTRVIMCQMEVFEKSLKEAQRKLLQKADWGQPVLPSLSEKFYGGRRWKRHRAARLSEDEEENGKGGEKENCQPEEEKEQEPSEDARDEPVEETQEDAETQDHEICLVVSSPETTDGQLDKRSFFSQEEPESGTAEKPLSKLTPDESEMSCPAEQQEEEPQNEEDKTVCPETQMSESSTPELMVTSPAQAQCAPDGELMEVEEDGGEKAPEQELMEQDGEAAEVTVTPSPLNESMQCPMCSRLFPLSQIELHAAFCDGEPEYQEEESQVVRRLRTRRWMPEETLQPGRPAEMEKCYLCQSFFPPQEYPEHVRLCFERKPSKNLLSALERTEERQTGNSAPGPSDVPTKENGDPLVTRRSDTTAPLTSCSSSSYTLPSENVDSTKAGQRLSRKRKFKK
ncbi:hypothetical protein DNTS_017646 [Danionella cerebrum]|uniref:BRCA1-A complex subunit RAP80 n=1 Tax=Danionella cerebrum TaxID=2873325 RepID=A0A553MXB6_9TELE|nr:hypothetical protein DNTS_017646 [Danionella translucida]